MPGSALFCAVRPDRPDLAGPLSAFFRAVVENGQVRGSLPVAYETVSEARNSISRYLGFYNAAGATLLVVAAKSRELGDALKVRKTKAGAPRRTLTPRSLGLIVQSGEDCAGC